MGALFFFAFFSCVCRMQTLSDYQIGQKHTQSETYLSTRCGMLRLQVCPDNRSSRIYSIGPVMSPVFEWIDKQDDPCHNVDNKNPRYAADLLCLFVNEAYFASDCGTSHEVPRIMFDYSFMKVVPQL